MAEPVGMLRKASILRGTMANWPRVLADKAGVRSVLEYRTRSGTRILCRARSTDINEAVVVLAGIEYPARYLRLTDGAVVLDVGANIGAFSLFLDAVNARVRYRSFAFEPFP